MSRKNVKFAISIISILSTLGLFFVSSTPKIVDAQSQTPTDRTSRIEVDEIEYHWQLDFVSDKSSACDFIITHEGDPTDQEILNLCGQNLYHELKNTKPCTNKTKTCTGLYTHSVSIYPVHKKFDIQLSPPTVWVSLSGCKYSADEKYCVGDPELVFTGEEPLPNESIIDVQGNLADTPFYCDGNKCEVPLTATDPNGDSLSFWGDSSFGDSTDTFEGLVRVIPVEDTPNAYYIDVISSQWQGKDPPSCSDIWNKFPESLDLPAWLDTPASATDLRSDDSLYFLSAALINNGLVDASSCENNGLTNTSTANECGKTKAAPKVEYWQNIFDQEIYSVAKIDDVPAQLLKNIFLRESQLWPGIYNSIKEVGLGHLTDNGADTILLWNPDFFNSFCPLVLDKSVCAYGYAQLPDYIQSVLRGALLRKTNASCASCDEKIDLTKANFSIHVFAETLKANCSQVNQLFANTFDTPAGQMASYSDLWRFALINYNAGPGCLATALQKTYDTGEDATWENVAANLDPACRTAVDYVVDISQGDTPSITEFSTPEPTQGP